MAVSFSFLLTIYAQSLYLLKMGIKDSFDFIQTGKIAFQVSVIFHFSLDISKTK
jgi:hypothetical protein